MTRRVGKTPGLLQAATGPADRAATTRWRSSGILSRTAERYLALQQHHGLDGRARAALRRASAASASCLLESPSWGRRVRRPRSVRRARQGGARRPARCGAVRRPANWCWSSRWASGRADGWRPCSTTAADGPTGHRRAGACAVSLLRAPVQTRPLRHGRRRTSKAQVRALFDAEDARLAEADAARRDETAAEREEFETFADEVLSATRSTAPSAALCRARSSGACSAVERLAAR